MTTREERIAETFVELADTLVADFDVIDFLHTLANRSVELLDADAVGIMLADQRGGLHPVASSTEQGRLVELFEIQNVEGPGLVLLSERKAGQPRRPVCDAHRLARVHGASGSGRLSVGSGNTPAPA